MLGPFSFVVIVLIAVRTSTREESEYLCLTMSNLLFGSSNVYRNFARAVESGCLSDLTLVNCTRKTAFDAHLVTLTDAKLVVTSVLENFIVEVCRGVSDDEVQLFARQQITAHVEDLFSLVSRSPTTSVLIHPPMYRSDPCWFGSYLPDMISFLTSEVGRIGSRRMSICAPFVVVPSQLEEDGVHLTPAGGDRFLSHLDAAIQLVLAAELGGDDGDMETTPQPPSPSTDRLTQILDAVNRNSSQLETFGMLGDNVSRLSRTTTDFEAFVRRRFRNDDYIFARMKEESDADVNKSREDRVVITGLAGPPSSITTHAEKKLHYSGVVTRLIAIACASADPLPKVLDVFINLRKDRGQPLIEVRLDTSAGSGLFRREGVRLAKADHAEFSTLYFSNSVTQSTRVRIDILKELAKKLTTLTETAYVQGFISRPVLQYRVRDGSRSYAEGVGRSYTFVDAIAKFGSKLAPKDLSAAYVRAGDTFAGALSQYFVVLSDEAVSRGPRLGINRAPLGRRGAHTGAASRGGPFIRGANRHPHGLQDRGVKRAGDPATATPSKKKEDENDLIITE